jgi:phosphoribosylpyrophosphate synthetase
MDKNELALRLNWGNSHELMFERLRGGLLSETDPVTWRTLVVDSMTLMGSANPDVDVIPSSKRNELNALGDLLLTDTWLGLLRDEWLGECGLIMPIQAELHALDIFVNARHKPEPLLFSMARLNKLSGKSTAVVNPVGHYADKETRIVFPMMRHRVNHLIVTASTQELYGGSFSVLTKTLRILREPELAKLVQKVDVVVPMWGGSRGHKRGQRFGNEVLEAKVNSKMLAVLLRDIYNSLVMDDGVKPPSTRIVTVDIHNDESIRQAVEDVGFEFVNANPMKELSRGVSEVLIDAKADHLPIVVVSCDAGSIERSKRMVYGLFDVFPDKDFIDLALITKLRTNGEVGSVLLKSVKRFYKNGNEEEMQIDNFDVECNVIETDDMLDSGGTAGKDGVLLRKTFTNIRNLIFVAPHLVASNGVQSALDKVGADYYVFGNTLNHDVDELNQPNLKIVDVAPSILRAIG